MLLLDVVFLSCEDHQWWTALVVILLSSILLLLTVGSDLNDTVLGSFRSGLDKVNLNLEQPMCMCVCRSLHNGYVCWYVCVCTYVI